MPTSPNKTSGIRGLTATTPGKMRLGMGLVFLLAIGFAIAGYLGVTGARSSLNTIARDAVPSIVTAQTVRVKLLEMDALATQEFLAGGADSGSQARIKYEAVRRELGEQLTIASKNISFGKDEQSPIEKLMENVQIYTGMVESARVNNRQGYPVGAAYLRMASIMLHNEMLPLTQSIDQLNVKQLEDEYAGFKQGAFMRIAMFGGAGLALLVVLGYMQMFLSRNMRRTFNLPLMAASAIVVAVTGYSVVSMTMMSNNLASAKEVSFVSAYNWLTARGTAYDTKTDQSLYLIALGAGAKYETSMKEKVAKLAPADLTQQMIDAALRGDASFKGLFADEIAAKPLGSDERRQAVQALTALRTYLEQDSRIRTFDKSGRRAEAVNLALGNGTQEAQGAFDAFTEVLAANLEKATQDFDLSVARAEGNMRFLDLGFIIISLLVMALTYLGLTPRINEYRV